MWDDDVPFAGLDAHATASRRRAATGLLSSSGKQALNSWKVGAQAAVAAGGGGSRHCLWRPGGGGAGRGHPTHASWGFSSFWLQQGTHRGTGKAAWSDQQVGSILTQLQTNRGILSHDGAPGQPSWAKGGVRADNPTSCASVLFVVPLANGRSIGHGGGTVRTAAGAGTCTCMLPCWVLRSTDRERASACPILVSQPI